MKIVVIIATINRPNDLHRVLESIKLSKWNKEVLVIDQSEDEKTKQMIKSNYKEVKYYHSQRKSLVHARNIGISKMPEDTDIVIFFDDDITVPKDVFNMVVKYLDTHQKCLWWNFNIKTPSRKTWILKKIWFFLLTGGFDFARQFISSGWFNAMFLEQPENTIPIERTSGCAMFFRKSLLDQWFRFPEKFEKYSLMEDVFFSYAIHKKYPNSLHYLPEAKIIHHESPIRSVPPKAKILQNIIHRFLFIKEFQLSYSWYAWTILMLSILDIITYRNIQVIYWYIQWLYYITKNHKKLNLEWTNLNYNDFIFQK